MTSKTSPNVHLLVIDPQNDFCDPNGSLYVKGAEGDMDRVAGLVDRMRDRLAAIHVTLDSHRKVDISHPIWFQDARGRNPAPFTVITAEDLERGTWTTTRPSAFKRTLAYLNALATGGRYPHVIWPYHCLIGDAGHNVWPKLSSAVHAWEDRFAMAEFVTKGSNPWTEHFSAVQAEVPDPEDPTTQINTQLIATLEEADVILLAGEALSHCLANTVRDIANRFADPRYVSKLVLLTDASSNVTGFDQYGESFLRELTARGMRTSTTKDAPDLV
ncbi:MAG: cysteine hydrolase family protein [Deltaproteobacteria bacterium]|nr:cysteine hydrolase family protein [Deltaproteobacteria bacterium]